MLLRKAVVEKQTTQLDFIDDVERRSMTQHIGQLATAGRVEEVAPQALAARAA